MTNEPLAIEWHSARARNRDNWEDRVPLHEVAYAISDLQDPDYLTSVVRTDLAALAPFLPDRTVSGLDICHLQCHIGTDTLSLARAGANVPVLISLLPRLNLRRGLLGGWASKRSGWKLTCWRRGPLWKATSTLSTPVLGP